MCVALLLLLLLLLLEPWSVISVLKFICLACAQHFACCIHAGPLLFHISATAQVYSARAISAEAVV